MDTATNPNATRLTLASRVISRPYPAR
jgi:hypothetical protein